jgi:hypothetical protein
MNTTTLPALLCATLLATATLAHADNERSEERSHRPQAIAVFGDAPYGVGNSDSAEFAATSAFIDTINADREVTLALHVGDIHSGSQYCTEAYDRAVFGLWTRFQVPLVYTPGDNEWTDCHKAKEGGGSYDATSGQIVYQRDASGNLIDYMGGDPLANLDLVRRIFFQNPGHTLGAHRLLRSQFRDFDRRHPADARYVENVMFEQAGTVVVTLNIPGGSNNDTDIWYGAPVMSERQATEIAERTSADLRWLDAAFKHADEEHARAVVIQVQANMWDLDGKPASHLAQYKPLVERIATLTKAFGGPVLLLNGDSHQYRSDNPLMTGAPCRTESGANEIACSDDAALNQPLGYDVPNFHRIVVHGSTFPLEWLKLRVAAHPAKADGPRAFGPFSWDRVITQ